MVVVGVVIVFWEELGDIVSEGSNKTEKQWTILEI